jgi:hypothetical protein
LLIAAYFWLALGLWSAFGANGPELPFATSLICCSAACQKQTLRAIRVGDGYVECKSVFYIPN